MTMPDRWVEIAFRTDSGDGSPLWRNVTADVQWPRGVRIARRRSTELDDFQPGTMAFALDNFAGNYTPGNTASIHYPNVKINRQVRYRSRWPVSVNMVLEGQAKGTSTSLFSASQGSLALDTGVVASGQTSSIRWTTGTLGSTGQQLRLGSSATTTATSQAIPVTVGSSYTASCQVRRDASLALSVNARIRWYDGTGAFLSESTGSAVALSTSFQAATCTATAPANSVWARLVIANTTTTAGSVQVYLGAVQFEQAGSATTWVSPGVEYMRFVGRIGQWPHKWENGVLGQVAVTATDLFKLLDKTPAFAAETEPTILALNPVAYYPLNEPAGSTSAASIASTAQHVLLAVDTPTPGGSVAFGDPRGAQITPANSGSGKFLFADEFTAQGPTSVTHSAWVVIDNPLAGLNTIVMAGLLSLDEYIVTGYDTTASQLAVSVVRVGDSLTHTVNSVNIDDGQPHLVTVSVSITGASLPSTLTVKTYIDGVSTSSQSYSWSATTLPQVDCLQVAGFFDNTVTMLRGFISHVAVWQRELSAPEVADVYAVGIGTGDELTGARISRLLDRAAVTDTAVDTGQSLVGAQPTGVSFLQSLKTVARGELGLFFISRAGVATFHDRTHRSAGTAAFTLTADQCAADLWFVMDDALLANTVTVSGDGSEVTVSDQTSIDEHGVYSRQVSTNLATTADVTDLASILLTTYAQPGVRPGQISVEVNSQPTLWPSMLGSEIDQMATISSLPTGAPASSVSVWLEGVQDVVTDERWTFTFDASPANLVAYLILDDPVLGLLDSNILGW
jgi:hypothetical protein